MFLYFDVSSDEERPIFIEEDDVFIGYGFRGAAVCPLKMERSGGTSHDDFCDCIGLGGIRIEPRSAVCIENFWKAPDAFGHVGASVDAEPDDDVFSFVFDNAFFYRFCTLFNQPTFSEYASDDVCASSRSDIRLRYGCELGGLPSDAQVGEALSHNCDGLLAHLANSHVVGHDELYNVQCVVAHDSRFQSMWF